MFTGLVQDVGVVASATRGGMTDFWIRTQLPAAEFALGESIAVEGACLTVVERTADAFRVQASAETLRRTTLGELAAGSPVNLERALALGDRLGGHLVLGHVDAVGELLDRRAEGDSEVVTFSLPAAMAPWFIEKGSVTVCGVSLTVNTVEADRFSVALIPETLRRTTLGKKGRGAKVNLEGDLIGKYVARLFELRSGTGAAPGEGLSEAVLRAKGFGGMP